MLGMKGMGKSERESYISRMKNKLDEWGAEISELELNRQRLKSSIIDDHQALLDSLDKKMAKGRAKMKEIIESKDETWHTIKETTDSLLLDIRANLDSARKNYHDELEDD